MLLSEKFDFQPFVDVANNLSINLGSLMILTSSGGLKSKGGRSLLFIQNIRLILIKEGRKKGSKCLYVILSDIQKREISRPNSIEIGACRCSRA